MTGSNDAPILTRENLKPGIAYFFNPYPGAGAFNFLFSLDGIGVYFYDTMSELTEEHGEVGKPRFVALSPDFLF